MTRRLLRTKKSNFASKKNGAGRASRPSWYVGVQNGVQEADAREIETILDRWIARSDQQYLAWREGGERDAALLRFCRWRRGNYSQSRADISTSSLETLHSRGGFKENCGAIFRMARDAFEFEISTERCRSQYSSLIHDFVSFRRFPG